jgi:hypothetical protein
MRIRIGNLPRGRCTITTVAPSDNNGMPAAWLAFFPFIYGSMTRCKVSMLSKLRHYQVGLALHAQQK